MSGRGEREKNRVRLCEQAKRKLYGSEIRVRRRERSRRIQSGRCELPVPRIQERVQAVELVDATPRGESAVQSVPESVLAVETEELK